MTLRTVTGLSMLVGIALYYVLTRAWERWDFLSHTVILLSAYGGYLLGTRKKGGPRGGAGIAS